MTQQLLPWLQPLAERLAGLQADQRLPHAILLSGPPGWGQSIVAAWLAHKLLNLDSEQSIAEVAHPDLRWLQPDGAVIKIDQVRQLAAFAIGTKQSANCKVAVVDQAHGLNEQAANALLKTLEEPPADTYILLSTEYASRLLPTIRSRCQRFDVLPDRAAGAAWLESTFDGATEALAFEYGGAPLAIAEALGRQEAPLLPALTAARKGDVSQLQDALISQEPATVLLRWLRYLIAECSEQGQVAGLADVHQRDLMHFQDELLFAHRQFVSSNSANHRLQLERLALRFAALGGPNLASGPSQVA
ncbi:MAG: AAA family ATPase [Pseudomonadales bacterium]